MASEAAAGWRTSEPWCAPHQQAKGQRCKCAALQEMHRCCSPLREGDRLPTYTLVLVGSARSRICIQPERRAWEGNQPPMR